MTGKENNSKHVSTKTNIFAVENLSCRVAKKTGYLRRIHFLEKKRRNFDQVHEIHISQGTVVTFFRLVDRIKNMYAVFLRV